MVQKFDVVISLEKVAEMRTKWSTSKREFDEKINMIMGRLLHEAAHNYMSAEEVAKACGLKTAQVRSMMRLHGLDPNQSKTLLAKSAATALAENAELLGISVHDMDLMSPLAYLPMGQELRQQIINKTAPSVHEVKESYETEKDKIETALYMGIDTDSISVARGNVPEVAAWLAGEGFVSGNAS